MWSCGGKVGIAQASEDTEVIVVGAGGMEKGVGDGIIVEEQGRRFRR